MADLIGLTNSGDVVLQKSNETGQGPATRVTGGPSGGFSGFLSAGRAGQIDASQAIDTNNKTLNAIDKLVGGYLKPHIEAAEKKAYFDGMSQVAQGKALVEIQNDEPWYTKIYGPSATVKGAQAMTMMTALNQMQADFMDNMPALREQSPDAVRQYLVTNAAKLSTTGDPYMDAMIQGKLAEQFGPMLNIHTKQHVAYVQEQNNTAFQNALVSTGEAYQKTLGQDWQMQDPAQRAIEKQRMQDMFSPMPGQTNDAWNKSVSQSVQTLLTKGNFGAVSALRESEHWNRLSPQAREAIDKMEPWAIAFNQRNNPTYADSVEQATSLEIAVDNGAAGSWEQVKGRMIAKNKTFMQQEGSTSPYYDNNDFAQMQKRWMAGQRRLDAQREKAMKAQAEALDADAQRTYVLEAMNTGTFNPVAQNNLDPDIIQQTLLDTRRAIEADPNTPGGINTWIRKLAVGSEQGRKMVDNDLSTTMTVDANNLFQQGAIVTDAQRKSLDYARMMLGAPNGMAALSSYVGAENAAKMSFLIKSGTDLNDKSAMDAARKTMQEGWRTDPTKADITEVTDYMEKQDPGFIKRNIPLFGPGAVSGYNLNEDSKRNMIAQLAPQIAQYRRGLNMSLEEATQLAFNTRYGPSSGVDFVDGTFVEPGFNQRGQGLFATVSGRLGGMSQGSDDYQAAVKAAVTKRMSEALKAAGEPHEPVQLTEVDKFANKVAGAVNTALDNIPPTVPGLGWTKQRLNDQGPLTRKQGEFDPDDWKTVSGLQVGGGVLVLTRINKKTSRPTTVTVRPEDVITEFNALRKARTVDNSKGSIPMNEDAPGLGLQY